MFRRSSMLKNMIALLLAGVTHPGTSLLCLGGAGTTFAEAVRMKKPEGKGRKHTMVTRSMRAKNQRAQEGAEEDDPRGQSAGAILGRRRGKRSWDKSGAFDGGAILKKRRRSQSTRKAKKKSATTPKPKSKARKSKSTKSKVEAFFLRKSQKALQVEKIQKHQFPEESINDSMMESWFPDETDQDQNLVGETQPTTKPPGVTMGLQFFLPQKKAVTAPKSYVLLDFDETFSQRNNFGMNGRSPIFGGKERVDPGIFGGKQESLWTLRDLKEWAKTLGFFLKFQNFYNKNEINKLIKIKKYFLK